MCLGDRCQKPPRSRPRPSAADRRLGSWRPVDSVLRVQGVLRTPHRLLSSAPAGHLPAALLTGPGRNLGLSAQPPKRTQASLGRRGQPVASCSMWTFPARGPMMATREDTLAQSLPRARHGPHGCIGLPGHTLRCAATSAEGPLGRRAQPEAWGLIRGGALPTRVAPFAVRSQSRW